MNPKFEDGIYAAYMAGELGYTLSLLLFFNGIISGADLSGAKYDGKYKINNDKLVGSIRVVIPKGQQSIISELPSGFPTVIESRFAIDLPIVKDDYMKLNTNMGPVNVRIIKLRGINKL